MTNGTLQAQANRIKIFVCHTSEDKDILPQNPLFVHVIGGAALHDKTEFTLIPDNTGENISEKNKSFCELTVQYWAWKNCTADYYGFCHYRRYFNFSDKVYQEDVFSNVVRSWLTGKAEKDFGFSVDNIADIETKVSKYDCIVTTPFNTTVVNKENIYEQYTERNHLFRKDIDCIKQIIEEKYQKYKLAMQETFSSNKFCICNMFILKKDLFFEYCDFLFAVLFEFEKRTDLSEYNVDSLRTIGHLGERIFNIYYTYLKNERKVNIGMIQRVMFLNTEKTRKPKYDGNIIPVVFASNDYFVPYMSVMLQSIMVNSDKNRSYCFYILHRDISGLTKNHLERQVSKYGNFKIEFINVGSLFDDHDLALKTRSELTIETYFRLAIPALFDEFNKVICVDSDMVCVEGDVAELYDIDLKSNMLGSTRDIYAFQDYYMNPDVEGRKERYRKLGVPLDEYFLAGLLIFNIKEINKIFSFRSLIQLAESKDWDYQDQDVLNYACKGRVHFLSLGWGFEYASQTNYFPKDFYDKYIEASKNPHIYHYALIFKPWINPETPFSEYFWGYAIQSPFFGVIISRMIKNLQYVGSGHNDSNFRNGNILKNIVKRIFPTENFMYKILKKVYRRLRRSW